MENQQKEPIDRIKSELKLKSGFVLKNRIGKSAMAEQFCEKVLGQPLPLHLNLYKKWSEGGVGLIITGHVMVDRIQKANVRDLVIDDKADVKMFEKYAQHCKLNNTVAVVQINHPGR